MTALGHQEPPTFATAATGLASIADADEANCWACVRLLGGTVLALAPAEFGKLIAEETEKWAKVVKFSGAKPE